MKEVNQLRGCVLTILGGIFWGFSGACGQFLLSNYPIDPIKIVCIRLVVAGAILTIYSLMTQRKEALKIFKDQKSVYRLLVFSFLGILFCQFSYLTAVQYSNAGTATVLQYTGPVFIMIYVCIRKLKLPTLKEGSAIILAVTGTFLLATGGHLQSMTISPEALKWGLLSAIGLFIYTLSPGDLIKQFGSVMVTGYAMLMSGVTLSLLAQVPLIPQGLDLKGWLAIMSMILLGTVFAFTLYLKGVSIIGPVKASMLASTEPVSAALLSALWLGTQFQTADLLGFVCIVLTIFLLAKKERTRKRCKIKTKRVFLRKRTT